MDKPANAKPPPQPLKIETPSTSDHFSSPKQAKLPKSPPEGKGAEPTPVKKRPRKKAVRKSEGSGGRGKRKSCGPVEVSQLAPKPRGPKAKGRPRKRATPCYVVDARKDNKRETKGGEVTQGRAQGPRVHPSHRGAMRPVVCVREPNKHQVLQPAASFKLADQLRVFQCHG